MARGEKTRCGGTMTEAQFNSMIKSLLRAGSRRWAPISQCDRNATVRRGVRRCAGCQEEVKVTTVIDGKRKKNTSIDHIVPIVPVTGFRSWDEVIENMFCEIEELQLLCLPCHKEKSKLETAERAAARRAKKKKEVDNE